LRIIYCNSISTSRNHCLHSSLTAIPRGLSIIHSESLPSHTNTPPRSHDRRRATVSHLHDIRPTCFRSHRCYPVPGKSWYMLPRVDSPFSRRQYCIVAQLSLRHCSRSQCFSLVPISDRVGRLICGLFWNRLGTHVVHCYTDEDESRRL
jgi:hypothetical protein